LRHTFASLLVAEGLDVVYVSRQLGHADPSITLKTYAKLFDRHRHTEQCPRALEARFGLLLSDSSRPRERLGEELLPVEHRFLPNVV
jgi:hypothetical protein